QSFPIGIIGISMAISSFSILSHYVIDEKIPEMGEYTRQKMDHLFFLIIPAAVGLWVLRVPIIEFVLQGGVFDQAAVMLTADTLTYLCIGLVAASVTPLLIRIFFAFHNTFWPFVITCCTVAINTILALYFSKTMGIVGVGLASSLSNTFSLLAILFILRWKYFQKISFFSLKNFFLFSIASGVMAALLLQLQSFMTFSDHWWWLFTEIVLMTFLGMVIYAAVTFLFFGKKWLEMVRALGK